MVSLPTEKEGVLNSFSPSNSNENINSGGTGSSEEKTIDSFNVHPLNRWEIINLGNSAEVSDGVLNITDVGDNTADTYLIARDLNGIDDSVYIRFKITANATSYSYNDYFYVRLQDIADSTAYVEFRVNQIGKGNDCTVDFSIKDTDGNIDTLRITGIAPEGDWLTLRIDFDILKSGLRYRLYDDNNTRLFDYDINEITADRAKMFDAEGLRLTIVSCCYTIDLLRTDYIDYVDAPFKEREWTQTSTPGDADWLDDNWDIARVQDDMDDDSKWVLDVPYLDAVSGSMVNSYDTPTNMSGNDFAIQVFTLDGIEANNGTRRSLLQIFVGQVNDGTDKIWFQVSAGSTVVIDSKVTGVTTPRISFSMTLTEDRSIATIKGRVWLDIKDDTTYDDFVGSVDVSDYVVNPSQEFLIESYYFCVFTGDMEWTALIEDLNLIERDIFSDIGGFIEGVIGAGQDVLGGGADIFTALFRWLGGMLAAAFDVVGESLGVVFVAVGAVIVAALSPIATSLSTLASDIWSGIGSALDFLETAIGLVTTAVGNVASDVATAVWSGIGSAMDFITEAITGIAAAIWVAVLAVAQDLADLVVDIIDFLIGLAGDIVSAIWDFITTAIFFLWDALGLPDLLAVVDLFLVAFVELVNAIPAFIVQVIPRILAIWGLFAVLGIFIFLILPALASESVGEFFEKFIHYFFTDITAGASLLGFSIPVPAGFLWLVTVIYYVLGSTIYGGFFT